ncbi:PaaI family thioesterase [Tsukamurella soli]|uniref:PaaI family thioesterase n=1 Tax=Tsukamurella soli TaxID=644556 RepID=A0ABP8KKU1_9ACTN
MTDDTTRGLAPLREQILSSSPQGFDRTLGLHYLEASADAITAEFVVTPALLQPWGITHGGVYCSVIESVASLSGQLWLIESGRTGHVVGVNNNTDFLRAVGDGRMTARSTPVHRGRSQQLWLVEITAESGKTIARGQVRLQNIED